MIKQKIKAIEAEMHELNRKISLKYLGMKEKPSEKDLQHINNSIKDWIKRLREIRG